MKTFIACFVASIALSAAAAAASKPVRSLNDLPFKWEGVAGDLVKRVPATFTIDRIVKVTRDESSGSDLNASYVVQANLALGDRVVNVSELRLRTYSAFGDYLEITFMTDDELVFAIPTSVRYDEATDTYTLTDQPLNGARRFVLKAAARK